MIIDELKEVNADIAMMEELSLPVSAQKIQERESLESKYINEILIPKIKAQIQPLTEGIHKSFCLVVDHHEGMQIQVRIAEKTKLKVDVKHRSVKKVEPQRTKYSNDCMSEEMHAEWKKYIDSLPKGNVSLHYVLTQSFFSLSKLLRVVQEKSVRKYMIPLFTILKLPAVGHISLPMLISLLQPEQFVKESTKEGNLDKIVLWSQTQKVKTTIDGKRVKEFEDDGVTPVMVDKIKKIKEGQWSVKVLCELMTQREYFANQHK